MDTLSGFTYPLEKGGAGKVRIEKLSCGDDHCVALMSVGSLMVWGGN